MNKRKMEVLYMPAENLTAAATALHGFKVLPVPTVLCPRNVVRKSLKFLTVPGTTDGRWKLVDCGGCSIAACIQNHPFPRCKI
jgi:hypothetical protein